MLAWTGLLLVLFLPSAFGLSIVEEVIGPEPGPGPEPEPLPPPLCQYIASVPRLMRPGQWLNVFVAIYPTGDETRGAITVELRDANKNSNNSYALKTASVNAAYGRRVSIMVPRELDASHYRVLVSGTGAVPFLDETLVQLDRNTYNGFVQTDKGMYNPGNTVRYRVLSLDQNLRTYSGEYDVVIYDAAGNRIKQDLGVSDKSGLIDGELKLSEEPVMGEWKIDVKSDGMSFSKIFEVRQYVLPRFSVSVTPMKSFVVSADETVQGAIGATYTSGKPVKGSVVVTAKVDPWYSWYDRTQTEQPTIQQTLQIDGQVLYSFSVAELTNLTNYFVGKDVTITAEVTEDLTGETASESAKTKVYSRVEKIEFVSSNPSTFKPKLKYYGQLKVQQQDGKPLIGERGTVTLELRVEVPLVTTTAAPTTRPPTSPVTGGPLELVAEEPVPLEAVPIMVEWWNPYPPVDPTEWITLKGEELEVSQSGIVEFAVDVPENAKTLQLTAKYGDLTASTTAKKFHSPSESYLQLTLGTKLPQAGDKVKISLLSNVKFSTYTYLIMSRGRIVKSRTVKRRRSYTSGRFSFTAKPEMAPTSRVVVFFKNDNEIVPDGLTFNVMGAFKNKVSMEFDDTDVQPGDKVNLKLKAAPGSLAATLIVDKSVILLKSGFDISSQEVLDGLGKFDVGRNSFPTYYYRRRRKRLSIMPWPYPTYGGAEDAKAIFEEAGLLVMTDGLVYDYIEPIIHYPYMMMAMEDMAMAPPMAVSALMEVERIRTRFIETWLWSLVKIGKSGEVDIPMVAPDTMTTWVGTAFAVNRRRRIGFGMTEVPTEVTVLKPFFVNVVLPYSVIRGEEIALQANVFNYMNTSQEVVVELSSSDGFDCLDIGENDDIVPVNCTTQTVQVESNGAVSVFFPIRPRTLGQVDITVTARSTSAADGLTKQLLVEPEGIPQEYNQAVIVDLSDGTPGTYEEQLQVDYPANLVEGSQRVIVKVLGDLLSNTLNSMSKLLKMSYGCGEQNMINFAPTVFVANYLDGIGQLTAERETAALDMISSGYQRQMNYMRHDGSFSAFGNSDSSGSTWLTLFVWKSFTQAKKYITIDEVKLQKTLAFIESQQNADGSFNEPGRVIHREMQGGSANGIAMTAYGLAALLENNDGSLNETISKAQVYVEERILDIDDPYVLTICAYALELANSPILDQVRQKVKDASTNDNGHVYWKATVPAEDPGYRSWHPPNQRAMAINVEATAYGLLSCAEEGDLGRCLTILPWLVNQQNSNGGFVSTQDTVVAVHALSTLASAIYSEDIAMTVTVASGGEEESFDVDETNRFIEQTALLRGEAGNVTVSGSGRGRVIVQLSVRFNIYEDILEPSFNASVGFEEQSLTSFTINVCISYLLEDRSGMALVEVNIPTGFSVTGESESFLRMFARRAENLDTKITLYFDEIDTEGFCFPVTAIRTGMAANIQPVNVIVSDYYEPDQKITVPYLPRALADSDVCDVCKENCEMCQKRRRK